MAEKLFRSTLFSEGYGLGNEDEFKFKRESDITKLRQDYVNTLFDLKAKVDKGAKSLDDVYVDLLDLIEQDYFHSIRDLELAKADAMKKFYSHEGNMMRSRQS